MVLALPLLLACTAPDADPAPLDPRFEAWRDDLAAQLDAWQVPGMGLALVVDGQVSADGIGTRLWGEDLPVDADTPFRIASVSKMLTAMALLTEVEAGRLDLQAPLDQALQGVSLEPPHDLGQLSLHAILSHQGGLQVPGMPGSCDLGPDALEEVVALEAPTWQLWSEVGRFYSYSNNDYVLAGLAAQRSSGTELTALVRSRVLEPAGAQGLTYDLGVARARGHAVGHTMDRATGVPVQLHDLEERGCGAAHASSGGLASARDLAAVAGLLLAEGQGVLSADSWAALSGPAWSFSDSSWYGYGLQRFEYRGHESLVHTGSMGGYLSVLWVLPQEQVGVVVLVNADHSLTAWPQPWQRPTYQAVFEILDTLLGLDPWQPSSTIRPRAQWTRYVGDYVSPYDWGTVTVRLSGHDLVMDSTDTPGDERVPLIPYSRDRFLLPFVGSDGLTYWRTHDFEEPDADGRTGAVLSSRGIAFRQP